MIGEFNDKVDIIKQLPISEEIEDQTESQFQVNCAEEYSECNFEPYLQPVTSKQNKRVENDYI